MKVIKGQERAWKVMDHPGVNPIHPGFILGHPGFILGHPGFILGNPGFILGHPGIILGHMIGQLDSNYALIGC